MPFISDFEIAHKLTAITEGYYDNDPNDPGGETIFGIARKRRPDWKGWPLVDAKKGAGFPASAIGDPAIIASAKEFYRKEYWDKNRLSEIDQAVANELYDTGVNQGANTAGKYFQEALNLLNNNQAHYPDLKVDGEIGDFTIKTYFSYINTFVRFKSRTKEKNIQILLKAINGLQFEKYRNIAKANPSQEMYIYGWFTRI